MSQQQSPKSPAVAWALWFFLGGFGAHRFYFGKVKSGAGMAGLLGYLALAAWWVYDAFQMNKWLKGEESAQPARGEPDFAQEFAPDAAPMAPAALGMAPSTSQSEAA